MRRRPLLLLPLGAALPARAAPRVPLAVGEHGGHRHWLPLFALLAQALGIEWDLRPMPWPRAQSFAEQGGGLMFGLAHTPARAQRFVFSQPAALVHTWALVRAGEGAALAAPQSLRERTVCMARASSYPDTLRAQGIAVGQWLESDQGDPGALRMVRARRCDAALVTLPGRQPERVRRLLLEVGMPIEGLELLPRHLGDTALHFVTGVESRWRSLLAQLDQALTRERRHIEQLGL
ncbi:substrate-binding periplasmic protein [Inhella proteolytica]|uniref:Transporter substrate-binding domain-containing protein n=1 Tax=Inhella proteolytica TaxID=2795029 RepID=A0A931J658_9BURK|nr:transporter substrate-binding domain-containing protein [Inhella proteolytica]MBH9579473.1 transporter substrate-binding domain-containing protein [Inhella proteolytica]